MANALFIICFHFPHSLKDKVSKCEQIQLAELKVAWAYLLCALEALHKFVFWIEVLKRQVFSSAK